MTAIGTSFYFAADIFAMLLVWRVITVLTMACPTFTNDRPSTVKPTTGRSTVHAPFRTIYNMCVISPPMTITKAQIDDSVAKLRFGIIQPTSIK